MRINNYSKTMLFLVILNSTRLSLFRPSKVYKVLIEVLFPLIIKTEEKNK